MLKTVFWSATAAFVVTAALFVPLDPALFGTMEPDPGQRGLISTGQSALHTKTVSGAQRITIISNPAIAAVGAPPSKLEVRVVRYNDPEKMAPRGDLRRFARTQIGVPAESDSQGSGLLAARAVGTGSASSGGIDLARDLQNELRRVGCYNGRVDGDWGPASRFAMSSFVKSVNALLPIDRPDMVLLMLVRRHQGNACGGAPGQDSSVVTASVSPVDINTNGWAAKIVAPAPSPAEPPRFAKRAPALVGIPRIVRSVGITPVATVAITSPRPDASQSSTAVAVQPGPGLFANRMSLGSAPNPAPVAVAPVTATPSNAPVSNRNAWRRSPARVENTQQRRSYSSRRKKSNWKRKVYSAVDLSGN